MALQKIYTFCLMFNLVLFSLTNSKIYQVDVDIATHISVVDDGPNRR